MLRPVASWGDRIPHVGITKPAAKNVKRPARGAAKLSSGAEMKVGNFGAYRSVARAGVAAGAAACTVWIFVFGALASSSDTDSAIAAPR